MKKTTQENHYAITGVIVILLGLTGSIFGNGLLKEISKALFMVGYGIICYELLLTRKL